MSSAGCSSGSGSSGSTGGGSPNPTIVTFSFSEGSPTVIAAMIGSSAYAIQSLTSGKLSLTIPNGTTNYAVAYLCTGPSFPVYESVFEASTADGTSFTLQCPVPGPSDQTGTVLTNVDATGIPARTMCLSLRPTAPFWCLPKWLSTVVSVTKLLQAPIA